MCARPSLPPRKKGATVRRAATTPTGPWDYVTYAPPGNTCTACKKPIGANEPCRRRDDEQASRSPLVTYTHSKCMGGGAAHG